MVIYDTVTNQVKFYNGDEWKPIGIIQTLSCIATRWWPETSSVDNLTVSLSNYKQAKDIDNLHVKIDVFLNSTVTLQESKSVAKDTKNDELNATIAQQGFDNANQADDL